MTITAKTITEVTITEVTIMETSVTRRIRLLAAMLIVALLAMSPTAGAAAQGDETPDSPAVTVRVSCLGGNGRVDVLLDNSGQPRDNFNLVLASQSRASERLTRTGLLQPNGWERQSLTGRADGSYIVEVSNQTFGDPIQEFTVDVACDVPVPVVSDPEVMFTPACAFDALPDAGIITAHFVNASDVSKPYILDIEGQPNRSTTAGAYGSAFRQLTGLPDGDHLIRIRSNGQQLFEQTVTVNCTSGGYELGGAEVARLRFDPLSAVRDVAIGPDGLPVLLMESTVEVGGGNLQILRCQDVACRGDEPAPVAIEGRERAAQGPATLAFTPDGHAVFAFFDGPGFNPEDEYRTYGPAIAICSDTDCSEPIVRYFGPEPRFWLDALPAASGLSAAVTAADSRPLMTYFGRSTAPGLPWVLRFASCGDPQCAAITFAEIDTGDIELANSDLTTDLMISPEGNPVIVLDSAVVACGDPTCNTSEITIVTSETSQIVDSEPGPDGYPILLERSGTVPEAMFALVDCADARCSPELALRTALPEIPLGTATHAMGVSQLGAVGITYRGPDRSQGPLGLLRCADTSCADATTVTFDDYRYSPTGPAFLEDGRPVIVTDLYYEHRFDVIACTTPTCAAG